MSISEKKISSLCTENWKELKREVVKLISRYFHVINRKIYEQIIIIISLHSNGTVNAMNYLRHEELRLLGINAV